MHQQKFVHDDVVRLATSGRIGTVKEVHHINHEIIYSVELNSTPHERVDVPEADLELVKIANDEETGFAIRYIS
jgi:Holliday junction resolvase